MIDNQTKIDLENYFFSNTSFDNLMRKRIRNVLLICSNYDAFILEEDGRINEQVFNEYVSLNLRYPPVFYQASDFDKAVQYIDNENIDLVITMLNQSIEDPLEASKKIKEQYPRISLVILTPFSSELAMKLNLEEHKYIDHIFCWLGNPTILVAIIKLLEDRMNANNDINEVGVQAILLVEDSVRYYSSYLPIIYKIVFNQSKEFMSEGLNEHQKMLRMRGRPKILLATTLEESIYLFELYKDNILGVISDVKFKNNGTIDNQAGFKLCEKVKKDDPDMPFLIQSSNIENKIIAKQKNVAFIHKYSKTLLVELKNFINNYLGFGDFVFVNPSNKEEIMRAKDLQEVQNIIFEIPDETLNYHISHNHFSKWLRARALFPIASLFRSVHAKDFRNINEVRRFLFDSIAKYRQHKSRGVIAEFNKDTFNEYLIFSRIGTGSLGGKARGLAFLNSMIISNNLAQKYQNVVIKIPKTVIISTEIFDEFIENNELYRFANSNFSDEEILEAFIKANLPDRILDDLISFCNVIDKPIAVRSSSILEDSYYQPFAGIYSTYMLPLIKNDDKLMVKLLSNAIKSVYASVYYKESKTYMYQTLNVIDEEKMAIVLQEVVGDKYNDEFFPAISGVARSINFYPVGNEKPEEGICNIAFGLGKYIVDGGTSIRFSPNHPNNIIQLYSAASTLRDTQKSYYSLSLNPSQFIPSTDDSINLNKVPIKNAENNSVFKQFISYYDFYDNSIKEIKTERSIPLLTFSKILQHNIFPLSEIIKTLLLIGQKEIGNPIEIEFAIKINNPKLNNIEFNLLQIRPIISNQELIDIEKTNFNRNDLVVYSEMALGNGRYENIFDIVYLKSKQFNPAKSREIAEVIDKINSSLIEEKRKYILIGFGRWGSSDPWLGIPIRWGNVSGAKVIIETTLSNYQIDPSQGTHFFHNLTSLNVAYITINPFAKNGFWDEEYLSLQNTIYEDDMVKHVRFDSEITVLIDGRKNKGIIQKPNPLNLLGL